MKFLKCVSCGAEAVKIFAILTNGSTKTKCMGCGLASFPERDKKEKKGPEIIRKIKFTSEGGFGLMSEQDREDILKMK